MIKSNQPQHHNHLQHPAYLHHAAGHIQHPGHLNHPGHVRNLQSHSHLNPAVGNTKTNKGDWKSLNHLMRVAEKFKPLKSTATYPGQNAAFRITMKDNKPVFSQDSHVKQVHGIVAGIVSPRTFTKNNSGKRTAPYLYIKVPIKGLEKPGGALFIPKVTGKKSHVDLLTWKNQLSNAMPGVSTGTIHPEKQFLYWLKMQSAKDPDFAKRIHNIKMRMEKTPCVNCTKSIVRNIKGITGKAPQISIKVNDTKHNKASTHLLNHQLRHPSLHIKTVPGGISNPVLVHKVINAIANRHVKQGIPAGKAVAHANKLHTAAVNATPGHPMHKAVAKALAQHINHTISKPTASIHHPMHASVTKTIPHHVVNKVIAKAIAHQLSKANTKQKEY